MGRLLHGRHLSQMLSARVQSSTSQRQDIFAGVFVGKRATGRSAQRNGKKFYFAAEKRLSNELADTIGWAPATRLLPVAGAAGAAAVSVTAGLSGGRAAACFVSALISVLGAAAVAVAGIAPSGRGGRSLRLASAFGLAGGAAGAGALLAVASAVALPRPTLRARLLKNPSSDWD
jgi:hypothetical protein